MPWASIGFILIARPAPPSHTPSNPAVVMALSLRFLFYHSSIMPPMLIFGFLTPLSLLVAIFLNLNYITLAGVRPKDISINKAYQCEQGQNWTMLVAEVVLLATVTVSGCTWSIDHLLGLYCGI